VVILTGEIVKDGAALDRTRISIGVVDLGGVVEAVMIAMIEEAPALDTIGEMIGLEMVLDQDGWINMDLPLARITDSSLKISLLASAGRI